MASLTSLVVDRGLASMRQVEEALARQVLYGGDVASHLLEQIGAAAEADLIKALADQQGLRPAPAGPLPRGPDSLRRLVPRDLAQRHGFYPLGQEGRSLVVAVAAPLPDAVEADLGFALGLQIVQLATTLVRVRQGLARDYDLPLERRDLRQLAKIEGRPDPNPSTLPPPMANPPLVRPPPSADAFFDEKSTKLGLGAIEVLREPAVGVPEPEPPPSTSGPWPAASKGLLRWMQRASQQAPATTRARRRRGPMSLGAAEEAITQAATGDDAIQIFFEFAQQYFTYAALFVVHGDIAEGRDAYGPGSDRARVAALGIPLDLPGCLALARNRVAPVSVPLQREGIDATLAADLGRSPKGAVVVVPVVVRQRVVALVYGDDEGPVELAHAAEVIAAASLTGAALERLAIARKRRQSVDQEGNRMTPTDPASPPRPVIRSATLTGMSAVPRSGESFSPTVTNRQQKTQALARALGLQNDAPRTSVPPPTASTPASEEDASAPFRRITATFQAFNLRPVRAEGAESGRTSRASFRAPLTSGSTPTASAVRPSVTPIPREEESPRSEGPEVQVGALEGADELIDEVLAAERTQGWPVSERSSYHAPRMPPSERMLTALPSIIVDLGEEQFRLVERLLSSDQDNDAVLGEVLREGVRLVPALMAKLPGPLRVERGALERGEIRPSEAGPLLRAITSMRRLALPFVVVHSASNHLEARLYATLLLGEFPYPEAAGALVPRFFDPEPQIPAAALASARLLQGVDEIFAVLTASLGRVAASDTESSERKKKAAAVLALLARRRDASVTEEPHVG